MCSGCQHSFCASRVSADLFLSLLENVDNFSPKRMQLLHSAAIPAVEFASVSLLLRESPQGSSWSSGEIILLASPLSSCTLSQTNSNLNELHEYLNNVFKKIPMTKESGSGIRKPEDDGIFVSTLDQLWHDDGSLVDEKAIQVFRPSQGHGLGLYYIVVQEVEFIHRSFSVLLATDKAGTLESIDGVVLCVGVSGLHYAQSSSSLLVKIVQRLHDSATIMQKMGSFRDAEDCRAATDALLATLTTDDEERRTNQMVEAESVTMILDTEGDEGKASKTLIGSALKNAKLKSGTRSGSLKRGLSAGNASDLKMSMEFVSSADMARMTVDRLAVLSVAEKDTSLRKYGATGQQRRTSMELGNKNRVRRRRKGVDEADLKDFDFSRSQGAKALTTGSVSTPPTVSNGQSGKPLQGPHRDTVPRETGQRTGSVPTLTAPKNDHVGLSRRAGMQQGLVAAKKGTETVHHPKQQFSMAAFDAFVEDTNNDQDQRRTFSSIQFPSFGSEQGQIDPNSWRLQQDSMVRTEVSAKRVDSSSFDPFVMETGYTKDSNTTITTINSSPSSGNLTNISKGEALLDEDDLKERRAHLPYSGNSDDLNGAQVAGFPKTHNAIVGSVALHRNAERESNGGIDLQRPRIQVNIALNEDLTCSYRQSRISSCTIEGVVQVCQHESQTNWMCPDDISHTCYLGVGPSEIRLSYWNSFFFITQRSVKSYSNDTGKPAICR